MKLVKLGTHRIACLGLAPCTKSIVKRTQNVQLRLILEIFSRTQRFCVYFCIESIFQKKIPTVLEVHHTINITIHAFNYLYE